MHITLMYHIFLEEQLRVKNLEYASVLSYFVEVSIFHIYNISQIYDVLFKII